MSSRNVSSTDHRRRNHDDQPFKRGPLSASVSGDTLTMEYGCADLADVRRCLADEGRRCYFVSWVVGLLDNVTLADGVDLA